MPNHGKTVTLSAATSMLMPSIGARKAAAWDWMWSSFPQLTWRRRRGRHATRRHHGARGGGAL